MEIRPIPHSQLDAALALIWETFLQFEAPDYLEEGVRSFRDFIESEEKIASMEFFGAYETGALRGVLATRESRRHICCFFVKAEYHRQGIGRLLWEYLLNNSANTSFTVNSSPYAVPVYHKFGFVDTDREQQVDGIRFTPMRFTR